MVVAEALEVEAVIGVALGDEVEEEAVGEVRNHYSHHNFLLYGALPVSVMNAC